MRASAVAERAGIRSASVVASAFMTQARVIARSLGSQDMAIAEYPGIPMIDSEADLRAKVETALVKNIVNGLAMPVKKAAKRIEPGSLDIIFRGTLDEVQEHFIKNLWTDGLPIIPPTLEKVAQFLRFTDHPQDEVIGVLPPENREATVWNVAVNGAMAGCRPEYFPVLLAVVEAVAEPSFRIQDAGSTPGWEPLIILNGPIIKELDFNYEAGVMRVGRQANTSIGRFLRLYMRNVAGLRIMPGGSDKGSISGTFNVVLAENEEAVAEIGWKPFSVDQKFKSGENVVTVQSAIWTSPCTYSGGSSAREHMETITEVIGRRTIAYWTFTAAQWNRFHPLIVMSPSVAKIIARDGWTKDDVKRYLYENTKTHAGLAESFGRQAGVSSFTFCDAVERAGAPKQYCESHDPDRLVPVFLKPEWIGIVVSGDPGRNQSKAYVQNHEQGPPTSKKIRLPAKWEQLLKEAKKG